MSFNGMSGSSLKYRQVRNEIKQRKGLVGKNKETGMVVKTCHQYLLRILNIQFKEKYKDRAIQTN